MRMVGNPTDSLDTSSDGAQDVLEVRDVRDDQGIKGNRGKALASCKAYLACLGNQRILEVAEIYLGEKDCSNPEADTCLENHGSHTLDYQSQVFQNYIPEDHGVQCLDLYNADAHKGKGTKASCINANHCKCCYYVCQLPLYLKDCYYF
jgi:hypothetical protein